MDPTILAEVACSKKSISFLTGSRPSIDSPFAKMDEDQIKRIKEYIQASLDQHFTWIEIDKDYVREADPYEY